LLLIEVLLIEVVLIEVVLIEVFSEGLFELKLMFAFKQCLFLKPTLDRDG